MITIVPKITEKQFKQDCLHGGYIWYVRKYAKPADKIGWFYASYNCDDIKCSDYSHGQARGVLTTKFSL